MWVLIFLLLAVNAAASAQQTRPRPVMWFLSLSAVPQAGASGVLGVAELRATIDAGWHLYSMTQPPGGPRATRIEIPADSPFRFAGPIHRKPQLGAECVGAARERCARSVHGQ